MPDPASNTTGPYGLLRQYLLGIGRREQRFTQDDPYTVAMRAHPALTSSRSEMARRIELDCLFSCTSNARGKVAYSLGRNTLLQNIGDFISTMVGTLTGGLIGKDPQYGVIGSFSSSSTWKTSIVTCAEGKATVDMHLENSMGAASMTRYSYDSPSDTLLPNDPFGEGAPFATTQQSWEWEEEVSFEGVTSCGASSRNDTTE